MKNKKLPLQLKASLTILLCGLSLAGCAWVATTKEPPLVQLPMAWEESASLIAESNLPYIAWWHKFNDPLLNQLIESALINNNSVKNADANIEMARAQLKAIELSWIPTPTVVAGYTTNPLMGSPGGIYGASLGYSAFNLFSMIAQQKSAKLLIEAQQQALSGVKLTLIGQVTATYFTLIAEEQQLALFQKYQQDLEEILRIKQEDYEHELASQIAVKDMAQQIEQIKLQQKIIERNIIAGQNSLHYLLDQNPGKFKGRGDFSKATTSYPQLSALPAIVIGNRPDVALAAKQYQLAAQNVTFSYTKLLPTFTLDYGPAMVQVGSSATPSGTPAAFQDEYLMWSLNPAVFGNVGMMKANEKAAYYNYIDTVRKALHDVSDDLTANRIASERTTIVNNAYLDAQDKYQLNQNLYKQGIIAYIATLQDKINLDLLSINQSQLRLAQMLALVKLYQDMGGGYKYSAEHILHASQTNAD